MAMLNNQRVDFLVQKFGGIPVTDSVTFPVVRFPSRASSNWPATRVAVADSNCLAGVRPSMPPQNGHSDPNEKMKLGGAPKKKLGEMTTTQWKTKWTARPADISLLQSLYHSAAPFRQNATMLVMPHACWCHFLGEMANVLQDQNWMCTSLPAADHNYVCI